MKDDKTFEAIPDLGIPLSYSIRYTVHLSQNITSNPGAKDHAVLSRVMDDKKEAVMPLLFKKSHLFYRENIVVNGLPPGVCIDVTIRIF